MIVVGGGVLGLSCAWSLTQAAEGALDVVLVEREPRHDAHSTGRSAEILRVGVDDEVTRFIALESAELLADPARAGLAGEPSFVDGHGLVVVAEPGNRWTEDVVAAGAARTIDRAAYDQLVPWYEPTGDTFVHFPRGGRVDGPRLVRTLARRSMQRGVRFIRSRGVERVLVEGGRVRGVALDGGEHVAADAVVLAAGAWSSALGAAIGAPLGLCPTRRHLVRFAADLVPGAARAIVRDAAPPTIAWDTPPPIAWDTLPPVVWDTLPPVVWDTLPPVVWDDVAGTYLRRAADGTWLFCVSDQTPVADVDARDRYAVDAAVVAAACDALARHLGRRAGDLAPIGAWSGFRDLSPDDRPILGPDGRVAGLHWCAGAGGHGFTLSLGVGRAFAQCFLAATAPVPERSAAPYAERCARQRFDADQGFDADL